MREYIFVLGREPELSYLELISYFISQGITYKLVEYENDIAIFLLQDLDFDVLIKRLGGTVKIAEVFLEYKYKGNDNKLNYGISVYKGSGSKLKSYLQNEFKKEKVKAMINKPRERVFSPSEIAAKRLHEFVIYGKYYGKTIAVFDPKLYMERDETRPEQMLLHQISIRLARILINLSQAKYNLLDPYCGVGTVLQEAMISNINVIGIDIDPMSAKASKRNLQWLKDKYNLDADYKIINGDSEKITRILDRNSVQAVASEPYLGPYFKKMPHKDVMEKVKVDLERRYYNFFLELRQVMKKNGKVAIVLPRLKYFPGRSIDININKIINDTGFKISNIDNKVKFPMVSKGKFLDRLIYVFESV